MRIGDVVYFSPRFRFSELDLRDTDQLVEAVTDRLLGFYLDPASRLIAAGDAFAAGLLCCTAIDFLALCSGSKRPEEWLQKNIPVFSENGATAVHFWNWFRNGLVHEARVKSFGQFSLDSPKLMAAIGPALVVNPKLLLEAIRTAMAAFFDRLDEGQTVQLVKLLERYFEAEIAAAKQ